MNGLTIEIRGLDRIQRKLGDARFLQRPMRTFFDKSAIAVERRAKQNAPIDTGRLRSSITHQVDKAPLPMWAKVGTDVFYGPYQEFGTGLLAEGVGGKGGRHWPPSAALDLWARRHGIPSGYLVARAIGLRGGLRPRRYMRNALKDSLNDIKRFLREAGSDIAREWGKR